MEEIINIENCREVKMHWDYTKVFYRKLSELLTNKGLDGEVEKMYRQNPRMVSAEILQTVAKRHNIKLELSKEEIINMILQKKSKY